MFWNLTKMIFFGCWACWSLSSILASPYNEINTSGFGKINFSENSILGYHLKKKLLVSMFLSLIPVFLSLKFHVHLKKEKNPNGKMFDSLLLSLLNSTSYIMWWRTNNEILGCSPLICFFPAMLYLHNKQEFFSIATLNYRFSLCKASRYWAVLWTALGLYNPSLRWIMSLYIYRNLHKKHLSLTV